jgi:hypothetical protein
MSAERVELRTDTTTTAAGDARSGIRLSRLKGGEHSWILTLLAGEPPDALRATIAALIEIDRQLERAYTPAEPRVHVPPRPDNEKEF